MPAAYRFIGFSAGLMLATALHELLPTALESNPHYAMWGAILGFMSLYIAERWTHFHACRHLRCDVEEEAADTSAALHQAEHNHTHEHAHVHPHPHGHADTMALVGMSIHNFADGLTVAAAFAVSHTLGAIVVFAVVLHQMAAGLSLSAIMLRLGRSHQRVLTATTTIVAASFIVLGALFYFWVIPVGETVQGFILGIAAGSFLYVAACDLLPEAHAADEGWSITTMTLVGYGFALLVKQFVEPAGH
ncbi:MAG TPA: ZIP family metal transporter [Abditibacteriaceae bacterium]|nr:ZIP family metal transporter [Abditibacteriaceae bacterium]